MERRSRVLFTMKSCQDITVNYMKLKRCSKERKINFWSNGKDMKSPYGLIANLSKKQSSKFYLRKMTLINVKNKHDLIKLKKNLIKMAEEEKTERL